MYLAKILKNATIFVVCAALVCLPATAKPGATYIAPKEQRETAKQFSDAFRNLADLIPASSYDVDARAEALDYDLEAAAEFVSNSFAFDPYIGILRGPQGTLRAEAGSAWDQAALLVSLIYSMGGDAMIVRGNLSNKDAKRLLQVTFKERPTFDDPFTIDQAVTAFGKVLTREQTAQLKEITKPSGSVEHKELVALGKRVVKKLRKAMSDAGKPIAESASTDELLEQLSTSYVWVRYRSTPNDEWQDVHPAFGGEAEPDVSPIEFITDNAPAEWVHFLKIELEIERTANGKATTEAIMAPYQGTVASFSTHHTRLDIAPNRIPQSNEDNPEFFSPAINGKVAERAKAFTFLGLTAPAEDAAQGPAIFATVSDKYADALTSLGASTGDDDTAPRLTGIILKVTHTAPGGDEKTEIRRITDFREGTSEDAWKDVMQSVTFGVLTGPTNGAIEARGTLTKQAQDVRALPYVAALIEDKITIDEAIVHPAFDQGQTDVVWTDLALLANMFQYVSGENEAIVRSAPFVINQRLSARTNDNGLLRVIVDIMHNEAAALRSSGDAVELSPTLLMKQGVWETIAENFVGGWQPDMDWLDADPLEVLVVGSDLENAVRSKGALFADRLTSDFLQAGSVVTLNNLEHWWRVHPDSGQVLGMSINGGALKTEYALLKSGLSIGGTLIGALLYYESLNNCDKKYGKGTTRHYCCYIFNIVAMVGSGAFGAAAGSQAIEGVSTLAMSIIEFVMTGVVYNAIIFTAGFDSLICEAVFD